MKYLGNLTEDQTIDFKFSTHKADGTPITLAGSPVVKVYKANATNSETDTGVTLSVDFDGVTGLHNVRIVTTDAFYAVANDYSVVITTGTVDGVSVVGTVLATFSIENRFKEVDVTTWLGVAPLALSSQQVQAVVPTTQKVDVETIKTKAVSVDAGGTTFPSGTVAKAGDAMALTSDERTALVGAIEADLIDDETHEAVMAAILSKLDAAWPDIDSLTLSAIATAARDAILNRVLSGNHDTAGSVGKLLQDSATESTSAIIRAVLAGVTSIADNGDGTSTVTYYDTDGETALITVTCSNTVKGSRTASAEA